MANQHDKNKQQVRYSEWKEVYAILKQAAIIENKDVSTLMRELAADKAKRFLKSNGLPLIPRLDPKLKATCPAPKRPGKRLSPKIQKGGNN